MSRETRTRLFWIAGTVIIVIYALTPVVWIASLSLKPGSDLTDGKFWPRSVTWENYRSIFNARQFPGPLRNSFGIALLSTFFAVILPTFAPSAIPRLISRGKPLALSGALAIAFFPPIS